MAKGNEATAKMIHKYIKAHIDKIYEDKTSFKITYLTFSDDVAEYLVDTQYKIDDEKFTEFRYLISSFDPSDKTTFVSVDEVVEKINKRLSDIVEDLNKLKEPEVDKNAYIKQVAYNIHDKLEEALTSLDGTVGYFKASHSSGIQVLIDEVYPLIKQINDNIESINKLNESTADALMNM